MLFLCSVFFSFFFFLYNSFFWRNENYLANEKVETVFLLQLQGKGQDETTGTTFSGVVRAFEAKILPEEPENETDVDDCIK